MHVAKEIIYKKAIITKYHGPTDTRGSRITASDEDGNKITIPYPYELSGEACHYEAAMALCKKVSWRGKLIGGSLKKGYVFVFVDGAQPNLAVTCSYSACAAKMRKSSYMARLQKEGTL